MAGPLSRPTRALAGLAATASLAVTAATLGAAPASSAPAPGAGECAVAMPQGEVLAGDRVSGLTVSRGTTPEGFSGEVIGVLRDGIAPGLDMIMVRLTSTEIDRVGGIWAGMSGSPVYARDGRLIGAVAYGLAYGASPVAGVTPYEAMDDYLTAPAIPTTPATTSATTSATISAARVPVSSGTAQRIATESDVTVEEAGQGFTRLPVPVTVSGVSGRRLAQSVDKRTWLGGGVRATGSASGAGSEPGAEAVVPGGNLAASLSWGDITMGGVGTATEVCDNQVVGFGHPMEFLGRTTEALHGAEALYIQEDKLGVPFKVANFGAPVGTITQDRLAGLTGVLGTLPDSTRVSSALTHGDRSRTGTSHVAVSSATADVTFYQLLANHDRVLDGYQPGSEVQQWTVRGTGPDGTAFSVDLRNRYVSGADISFESPWDVADMAWLLSRIPGVSLDSIDVRGTVVDDTTTVRVLRVEQYRARRWVRVDGTHPIVGRAGHQLVLRTIIGNAQLSRIVRTRIDVPARARGTRGAFHVAGGAALGQWVDGNDLAKVLAQYRSLVGNDEVKVDARLRRTGYEFHTSFTRPPRPWVVRGQQTVPMLVLR